MYRFFPLCLTCPGIQVVYASETFVISQGTLNVWQVWTVERLPPEMFFDEYKVGPYHL